MILCLDYGTRYIGVAITDPDERLALRYEVIDAKRSSSAGVSIAGNQGSGALKSRTEGRNQSPSKGRPSGAGGKYVLERLAAIVAQEKVDKVLVGVPISLSGKESQQTHITRDFIQRLQRALAANVKDYPLQGADTAQGVVIEEVDETLTSVEAERRVAAEGGKKEDAHMEAARMMLEEHLTKKH